MKKLTEDEILKLRVGDEVIIKYIGPTRFDPLEDELALVEEDIEKGNPVEITGVYNESINLLIFDWLGITDTPAGPWGLAITSKRRKFDPPAIICIQNSADYEVWQD